MFTVVRAYSTHADAPAFAQWSLSQFVPRSTRAFISAASHLCRVVCAQWLEKYRPREIKDIVGNIETVGRLEVLAHQGNMPNLILSGPPGTGKTTSVLCLARALLGDAYKEGVLELNASDERGIDVVRNRIKAFAQKKVTLPPGKHKVIILDEADAMTDGAQQVRHCARLSRALHCR